VKITKCFDVIVYYSLRNHNIKLKITSNIWSTICPICNFLLFGCEIYKDNLINLIILNAYLFKKKITNL